MAGRLYGIGLGPGDPELMTLKAVRLIGEADVVALPGSGAGRSVAASIAGELLENKEIAWCPAPMTSDQAALRAAHEQTATRLCDLLGAGQTVAFLCLGDVTLYSSFMLVCDLVRSRGYDVELVPGVTSLSAAAARLGQALCQGDERLLVASAQDKDLDEVLDFPARKVLVKPGRDARHLQQALSSRGLLAATSAVSSCGMPDERMVPSLLEVGEQDDFGYLTVYLVS